ncbi:hypothetical protein Golob_021178, partial [Gossypium lobatum]|nr:hypothetical protein [Gossypium lobatum]
MEAIQVIQGLALNDLDLTLVRRINQILSSIEHWIIRHIPKEDNGEADEITKLVQEKRESLQ